MKDIKKIIGVNLRYVRFQSGLSQEKFYEKYNLNPKYLACVERGEINIGVEFLAALATVLKIDITELIIEHPETIIKKKRIDERQTH